MYVSVFLSHALHISHSLFLLRFLSLYAKYFIITNLGNLFPFSFPTFIVSTLFLMHLFLLHSFLLPLFLFVFLVFSQSFPSSFLILRDFSFCLLYSSPCFSFLLFLLLIFFLLRTPFDLLALPFSSSSSSFRACKEGEKSELRIMEK